MSMQMICSYTSKYCPARCKVEVGSCKHLYPNFGQRFHPSTHICRNAGLPARNRNMVKATRCEQPLTISARLTSGQLLTFLAQALTMRDMETKERFRILVVDDDARLRNLLERYLDEQGFAVKAVADAPQMDRALTREHFDLMVLDLMLPGEDGLSICRRLRGTGSSLPIVMLTARGDEVDRIIGLEIGADDYLPKPFNPRELLARVNAVLRRRPRNLPGAPAEEDSTVCFGQVKVDLGARKLMRKGEDLPLTTGEFALLKVLLQHPREPLSRDRLMELARGREYDAFDRSIDVQMSRLRKLIEDEPTKPRYLQTVWGLGYVFVPDGGTAKP